MSCRRSSFGSKRQRWFGENSGSSDEYREVFAKVKREKFVLKMLSMMPVSRIGTTGGEVEKLKFRGLLFFLTFRIRLLQVIRRNHLYSNFRNILGTL